MSEHELWNEIGNLYYLSGCYNQAVLAYNKSILCESNYGKPYSNLALVFTKQGKFDDAIQLYKKSLDLLDDEIEKSISWNRLGQVYRYLHDYDDAVSAFRKSDELRKKVMDCVGDQSQMQFPESDSGGIDLEEKELVVIDAIQGGVDKDINTEKVKTLSCNTPDFGNNSSSSNSNIEPENTSHLELMQVIDHDIREDNEQVPSYQIQELENETTNFSTFLVNDDAGEEVNSSFQNDIKSDCEFNVSENQVDLSHNINDVEEDVQNLANSSCAEVNSNTKGFVNTLDEFGATEKRLARQIEINPRSSTTWEALGTLYKTAGRYEDAVNAFKQAISLDPENVSFHHNLGLVYSAQGDNENALNTFQKVLELDPDHSLAHASLGGYYKKNGLEDLAQNHIEKAMKNIYESENEYNRACLDAICGNNDRALGLLRFALENNQTYIDWVLRDPDLDSLRSDERFKLLVSEFC